VELEVKYRYVWFDDNTETTAGRRWLNEIINDDEGIDNGEDEMMLVEKLNK